MWKQKTQLTEVDAPELQEQATRLDPSSELPAPTAEEELDDQADGEGGGAAEPAAQTELEQMKAERDRLLDRLAREDPMRRFRDWCRPAARNSCVAGAYHDRQGDGAGRRHHS